MSLYFDNATSNVLLVPRKAPLDDLTSFTTLALVLVTGTMGNNDVIMSKQLNAAGGTGFRIQNIRSTGQLNLEVDCVTADAVARSANTAGNIIVAGAWYWLGYRLSAFVPSLYIATRNAPLGEVTGYATGPTTGTGGLVSDAAHDVRIGCVPFFNLNFPGRIAWVGHWNRALTLTQMRQAQREVRTNVGERMPGNVLYMHLGLDGAGVRQVDQSGYGHFGTVTGATKAPHPFLRNYAPRDRRRFGTSVAAPAGSILRQMMQHAA